MVPTDVEASADCQYDVALSFAGEDRAYVEEVADALRSVGVRVFYDKYEQATLWGKDLYAHLDWVYQRCARYCILFVSKHYAEKVWTNHERRSAQARALGEGQEYILPARFDKTDIPGLRKTVGYVGLDEGMSPQALASLVVEKLGPREPRDFFPPIPDKLYAKLKLSDNDLDERGKVLRTASSFFECLRRMTAQERRLVFLVFGLGCPYAMPENMHIDLDFLRRESGLAPSESMAILSGLESLGFRSGLGAHEDDNAVSEDEDIVFLMWENFLIYDGGSVDDRDIGPSAQEVAVAITDVIGENCCAYHGAEFFVRRDFSALSASTVVAPEH